MDPKSVAVYCRVSTQDQSCELQKKEILQYIRDHNLGPYVVYEDQATGTNGKRTGLKAMLYAIEAGEHKAVFCWKLDRLFRSLKDLITTLQGFESKGVQFVSLRDNIDLSTSSGRLMMHMLGAFAEFEANLIRERVSAGVRAAQAKGKKVGRPKVRDDALIQLLRSKGLSIRAIAREVKLSTTAVQRALKQLT